MHEGSVSSLLGMTGRPGLAEELMLGRDLALARLTGVRFHALHLSTAGSVALLRAAKAEGLAVTAEVTPHHLAFDHGVVASTDPTYKVNPPLRSADDVAALREALADGTIDAVATDHAPHAAHDKDVPFEDAPAGVIGLETAAAAVHTFAGLDPAAFFTRMSVAPAAIAGLGRHGRPPAAGSPANLVVFDPEETWIPAPAESRSVNSPFHAVELKGRPRFTVFEGRVTFADGKVAV